MAGPWVLHLGRVPDGANSAFWVPLTLMALMGGGMPTPEGGSEMLAQSLARLITDNGGVIRTGAAVERILVKNHQAAGVRTAGGEVYEARRAVVASTNLDPSRAPAGRASCASRRWRCPAASGATPLGRSMPATGLGARMWPSALPSA